MDSVTVGMPGVGDSVLVVVTGKGVAVGSFVVCRGSSGVGDAVGGVLVWVAETGVADAFDLSGVALGCDIEAVLTGVGLLDPQL